MVKRILFLLILSGTTDIYCQIMPNCLDTALYQDDFVQELELGYDIKHIKKYKIDNSIKYLYEEYTTVGGKINGTRIVYYSNACIKQIESYIMDIPIGLFLTFYPSGSIKSKFDLGYAEGDQYMKQTILERIDTILGEPIRTPYLFYYKLFNGPYTYYHENGVVEKIMNYKNGNVEGEVNIYNNEGKLISCEIYVNDVLVKVINYE